MPASPHRLTSALALAAALVAVPAVQAAPSTTAKGAQPLVKPPAIVTFDLANGLRVAVLKVDSAPIASVQLWVHAGSKDEPRDRRGLANLLEHLMFRGSAHVRDQGHTQMIAALGGTSGATSDEDSTHYVDTVPAGSADFAIQLEADRLRGLILQPSVVAAETEVAKGDARRAEHDVLSRTFLRLLETAFTKHPYSWSAAGALKDLEATTLLDLKTFYDAYYQPNNAMLVVVGNVDPAAIRASAEARFGAIPKAAPPPRPAAAAAEPAQTTSRREQLEAGQRGFTLVGFHLPAAADPDSYALQVASIVLGRGDSSRLKSALVHGKPPLALDSGLQMFQHEDPGLAVVYGVYVDPANAETIETTIAESLRTLGTKGPTPDELRKAKNQVQSAFVFGLEDVQGIADAIGNSWIQTGDPQNAFAEAARIEAVTAADVKRVVSKYMTPNLSTTIAMPPGGTLSPRAGAGS